MVPGLIESHAHLMGIGNAKKVLDLSDTRSYEELVARVAAAVKQAAPGDWILGRGWHQSRWDPPPQPMVLGFQTHHALSAVSPEKPVYLVHASGHAAIANARAMAIAGITRDTPSPEGGEIIKDPQGEPTGVLNETAQALVGRHVPSSENEGDRRSLELAIEECISHGITSFHDAGAGQNTIDLYREFADAGQLKIRLYVMLAGQDTRLLESWYGRGPLIGYGDGHLTVRAIKLYADGALGSRGAWLLAPYSDRAGHVGNSIMPMSYIRGVAEQALEHGFQLCTHAIGDRANREVLDQYEAAFAAMGAVGRDSRFRIEHAQHISAADIPRFGRLGVIAAMQAIHMSSDRPWAIDRLGRQRIEEGAYVWRKLLDSGAIIANGTDAPVEPINPIECFYAAVTRKTLRGEPPGGYEADQRMTRQEALRSYTLDAAYAAFEEQLKGSIEVGKLADFTVLSQDILSVPEERILQTKVQRTIVGGRVVYEAGG